MWPCEGDYPGGHNQIRRAIAKEKQKGQHQNFMWWWKKSWSDIGKGQGHQEWRQPLEAEGGDEIEWIIP